MRKNWASNIKSIIDVCQVLAGQSPKSTFYNKEGVGLPFYQGKKDFTLKYLGKPTTWTTKTTREAIKNDILMSVRAPVGPINIATEKICIGRGLAAIRAGEKVDNDYLFYFLLKHETEIVGNIGAVFDSINKTQIGEIQIPIPSLPEQKQIVEILDQAFEAIDQAKANIEKNIANAKELFQSKLNEVFSQKGEDWEVKTLNEICEVKDGTHDSPKYVDEEIGIPFVTQKNILEEGLCFDNTRFISEEDHQNFYRRSNVAENDILFAMIGANRGMVCIVDDDRVFSIKNVGLIKSDESYRSKFLLYYLKSPIAIDYVKNNSSGSAQGFIGLTKLRAFPVPYTTIANQENIEILLESINDSVNKAIANYEQKLTSLEELKKSILQKAFSGELTNPN